MASGSWLPWPLSIPGTLHHHSWILCGYVRRLFLLQHLKFVENGGLNSAHLNNFEHAVHLRSLCICERDHQILATPARITTYNCWNGIHGRVFVVLLSFDQPCWS